MEIKYFKTGDGKKVLALSANCPESDKSIKEVSDELNFPNISFLGKYVRTHLGMSPREAIKEFLKNGLSINRKRHIFVI